MTRRRKRKPNTWDDHYARQARKEKQPARSVYKLQEIQKKYRLMKKGDRVLDLGCAPGSWLLYAADQVGANGRVIGVDKKAVGVKLPPQAQAMVGDIHDLKGLLSTLERPLFDVVLSDMAPDTIGNRFVDAARSADLCREALNAARQYLNPGGMFVCKIFQGEDFKPFSEEVRQQFRSHKIFKPQSCRKASKEIYIIGIGRKQEASCQDTANGQP